MKSKFILILILISFFIPSVFSQTVNNVILKNYLSSINEIREKLPIEKLYLQLDKPYYNVGDTLHFKCYLLTADYLKSSTQSGLFYVELVNSNNKVLKRVMLPLVAGVSWGHVALIENDIPEGSYILRGYTTWMQNFGEDYAFKKNIYVSAVNGSVLINTKFKLDTLSDKNIVQATLQFSNLNKSPLMLKDMILNVKNGYRSLGRHSLFTDMDGKTAFDFKLADKAQLKNLNILVKQNYQGADTATIGVPVIINRPEKTDLQFMPEGGNLVAGIATKVGFKALSEDGKGANVSGALYNKNDQQILRFKSTHNGMGVFDFIPEAQQSYYAKIDLANGLTKNYPLPIVSTIGTGLKIQPVNDSLQLIINGTTGLPVGGYYLIAQSRNVVCYAKAFNFNEGKKYIMLPKNIFPTGIVRFTLLNSLNRPLNERMVYINHNDNLKISLSPHQTSYGIRDSIALTLQVMDKDNKPVEGVFSLAVTDNGQVKVDKTGNNLVNYFLLTSDLKGNIEEPGYYFEDNNNERIIALDNLLLTQGWVGYNWDDVFAVKNLDVKYQPEKEFAIKGKVTNLFNKPVKKTTLAVLRKHPLLVMDTLTNEEGRFEIKGNAYLPYDSAYFFIDVKNRSGKNFNLGVEVNEFAPMKFVPGQRQVPWYVNTDSILLNSSQAKAKQLQVEANFRGEGTMMKEVVIKEKRLIKGSKNPNPEETEIMYDEQDMDDAKTMSLLDFLQSKFNIFHINSKPDYYIINGHYKVLLIIDGDAADPSIYLNFLTAKETRGIEVDLVLTLGKYNVAKVYVTTFDGNGLYHKHIPGTYVYKPIPFTTPVKFYRPKYTLANANIKLGADMRSVIHWEPNILTDKEGKAMISFYSADKLSTYTVTAEGADLDGAIGSQQSTIKVDKKTGP